jgi:hypothetical protein
MLILDTTRISKDSDTGIVIQSRIALPYSHVCGPIEDASWMWPDEEQKVTCFYDDFGAAYHVLEPFGKVFDTWLLALQQEQYKSITFSQQ